MSEDPQGVTKYILDKYNLDRRRKGATEIPNTGRDDLSRLFAELGFRVGAEIGVEQGKYSEVLCRENPEATIYLVDPWAAYRNYREHVKQDLMDEFLRRAKERLGPFDNYKIVRKFSMEAVQEFRDGELDFVYIDGNHVLPYVINDIIEWSKKVRVGGIVSGHDYRESSKLVTQQHVVYAVNCYVKSYRIHPWFLLGRKAKVSGEIREANRSWLWEKR